MANYLTMLLIAVALSGCATHAATSGRVVMRDSGSSVDIRINDHDRTVIEDYYRDSNKNKGLPYGLAKRGGSLPPGLAKRDTLPPGLQRESLPYELERRLTPLPSIYMRVRVGQDIVLMGRETQVVFDVAYGIVK